MRRLQRILVETAALLGLWVLWDLRVALTAFIAFCVVEAFRQDPPAERGQPGRSF